MSPRTLDRPNLSALWLLVSFLLSQACGGSDSRRPSERPSELTVAAAANLSNVFPELGRRFESASSIAVVFSFGSTANLAHQIERGAPFDVYASADVEHVDGLVTKGRLLRESRAVYATGRLVLWAPAASTVRFRTLEELARPEVKFVAVAKPEVAPYGRAAMQALQSLDLLGVVRPKIVYAQNVNMAKQLAESGNADAAFTSMSLVLGGGGEWIEVEERLHDPVEQALGIVASSARQQKARRFLNFVLGSDGQALLARSGYRAPRSASP